jgi:hypothetical protein
MTVPEQLLHYIYMSTIWHNNVSSSAITPNKFVDVLTVKQSEWQTEFFPDVKTQSLNPHRFSDAGAIIRAGTHVTTSWSWGSRIALLNN